MFGLYKVASSFVNDSLELFSTNKHFSPRQHLSVVSEATTSDPTNTQIFSGNHRYFEICCRGVFFFEISDKVLSLSNVGFFSELFFRAFFDCCFD